MSTSNPKPDLLGILKLIIRKEEEFMAPVGRSWSDPMSDAIALARVAVQQAENCRPEWDNVLALAQRIEEVIREHTSSSFVAADALMASLAANMTLAKLPASSWDELRGQLHLLLDRHLDEAVKCLEEKEGAES